MARRIIWSRRAQNDRKAIFTYWNNRIKSNTFSKKLNSLFINAAEFIAVHPQTGKITDRKDIRVKFVNHYALLYEFTEDEIHLMAIFDTRQDPSKFQKIVNE